MVFVSPTFISARLDDMHLSMRFKGARFDFGEKYTFKNNFLGIEILVFNYLHVYEAEVKFTNNLH